MKKLLSLAAVSVIGTLLALVLIPENKTAPAFSLTDLQGKTVSDADLRGKVSFINFWFPSCPGFVSEMPKLIQMAKDYRGKNFQIIGIAVPVDSEAAVREYAAQHQLPFTVLLDPQKTAVSRFIKTELYPTSFLINQKGEIVHTFVGEPKFA